jgi:hypothetical protein
MKQTAEPLRLAVIVLRKRWYIQLTEASRRQKGRHGNSIRDRRDEEIDPNNISLYLRL